jgi:7-cyano-7-deazaguanine synthase
MTDATALVLFSGGQDSTTCLAWALDRFARVETVGFDYGQRHATELAARPRVLAGFRERFPKWRARLGEDHVLPLDVLKAIGGSALTDSVRIAMGANGLPTTFVPGRNLLFLATAGALAYRRGSRDLVGGMCETDFSGYPDCRDATIKAMSHALDLGMATKFNVHTPLMWIDKAATWALAESLGGKALVDLIIEETVTCYEGDRAHRHDWGYGCGTCPACDLRAKGYERYIAR